MRLTNWLQRVFCRTSSSPLRHSRAGKRCERLEARLVLAASHPFDLSTLDGTNGFRLDGIDINNFSGRSVSSAGDVNGDGFDDLIIGAFLGSPNGDNAAGESYVVFGKSDAFATVDLSTLDGTTGFRLEGIDGNDRSGRSVSSAGDVNGDGFDDLLIGAYGGAPNGNVFAGETYVVFGKSSSFAAVLDLSTLDGTAGFRLDGIDPGDSSGFSVSNAGDVNGDGFEDLLIGAETANGEAGEAYVVFGKAGGFAAALELSTLDGTTGFRINGTDAQDNLGVSVSNAGDVNGDGFDDVLIGAKGGAPNENLFAGENYVVFGKSNGFVAALDLATLDGTTGFRLDGIDAFDSSGFSVSNAGDVNGDGFDDLLIGALSGDPDGTSNAGESYVVFGKSGGFAAALDLSTLDGTTGFRVDGIDAGDASGFSVSTAGDVNGDGFDDLLIGAFYGDPNGDSNAGESYVVFGKSSGFSAELDLSTLDGTTGFRLDGIDADDRSGSAVSNAGDVNGDGFDDLMIGAYRANPNGDDNAGASYVVFGGNFTGGVETQVGTNAANTLTATQGAGAKDVLIGHQGADTLISDGGADVLYGGEGGDTFGISNLTFQRIAGGNGADTLRLDGSGITLDLTSIADNKLTDIEVINLTGSGGNTLTLNPLEVLNLSSTSNTLLVRRNFGDTVNMGTGWTQGTSEKIGSETFAVFTQGAATLKVQNPAIDLTTLNGATGFRLNGIDEGDHSGGSVSNAGDVNGDGFDDLLIGAYLANPNGGIGAGESYVVFGKASGFAAALDLAVLDGTTGFRLVGIDAGDRSGNSVSSAGDVNGDGFDDLLIGTYGAGQNGDDAAGESYVVFGKASGFTASLDLATLNGATGFRLDGIYAHPYSEISVSSAGDVNGDGFDDLLIGIYRGDPNGDRFAGVSYVVFGKPNGFAAALDLFTLDGTNGFQLNGIDEGDQSGRGVSSAGDVNGDGFDDLLIAAVGGDPNGDSFAGESYVVFGKPSGFAAALDLSTLDGTTGFRLDGIDANDFAGRSVSGAGDVNGDGFDDLLIGAHGADPNGESEAGESYVVFGKSSGFSAALDLSMLDGTTGFRLNGNDPADFSGTSVSSAGDVNGDGFDDLLIGTFYGTGHGDDAGESYVVFGKSGGFAAALDLGTLDGATGFRLEGIDPYDVSGRSVSGAGDVNGDGFDDVLIGAIGADPNGDSFAGESYVVFGRNFTGGVETQIGSSAANTLAATQGAGAIDVLIGQQGADTLISDGGADVLYGGEGGDTFQISHLTFQRISGGSGLDTLRLDGSRITLDLTAIADNKLTDIEVIDLTGSGNNTLTLNQLEVLNLSSTSNSLIVRRNTGDSVDRGTGWTQSVNETIGADSFEVFTQGAATLKVQVALRVAAVVSNGVLVIGTANVATDVRVTLDAGQIVVTSFVDSSVDATFNFAAASVTGGIRANLGSAADKFDASGVSLPTTVFGGEGNDTITGSTGSDSILGEGGNDVISLLGGDDWASGGTGNDTLLGGAGRDSLIGGEGADRLLGQGSVDLLDGGADIDYLDGGTSGSSISDEVAGTVTLTNTGFLTTRGDRVIAESIGNITLIGSSGADAINTNAFNSGLVTVFGGDGNDTIQGGALGEVFFGEAGDDVLAGAGGQDFVFGGEGNDTVNGGGATDVLSGGAGDDRIVAGNETNQLREEADANITVSTSGAVTTMTGLGTDIITGTIASVILTGGAGNNILDASNFAGGATLNGGNGNDDLRGTVNADIFFGGNGNDTLTGNAGNDFLNGDAGLDSLLGGAGADQLRGGAGNDTLDGGSEADRYYEQANADFTVIALQVTGTTTGTDTLIAIEQINLQGGSGANKLDARLSSLPVSLNGSTGNDTLLGSAFNDTLDGSSGDDVLSGGAGNDALNGSVGNDIRYETLNANATISGTMVTASTLGTDTSSSVEGIVLIGGVSANVFNASAATVRVTLIGGLGNDTLIGGSQPDVLIGGNRADSTSGTDSLTGNAGIDTFDDDGNDSRVTDGADLVLANIFASLPSWIDALSG